MPKIDPVAPVMPTMSLGGDVPMPSILSKVNVEKPLADVTQSSGSER